MPKMTSKAVRVLFFLLLMSAFFMTAQADWLDDFKDDSDRLRTPRQSFLKLWDRVRGKRQFEEEVKSTGRKFYVRPDGQDKTGEGSRRRPWRSLAYAVRQLKPGDTLILLEGVYSEAVDLVVSGGPRRYITIEADSAARFDGSSLYRYEPVFETNGQDYLRFKNLRVESARAAVEVNWGSHHIVVDGLRAERCDMAVWITSGSHVVIKDASAEDCGQAFRGEAHAHDVFFRNVTAVRNALAASAENRAAEGNSGFVFERGTHHLNFYRIKSFGHTGDGLILMGSAAEIDGAVIEGNADGMKLSGNNITVFNAVVSQNRRRRRSGGYWAGGTGIQVLGGSVLIGYSTVTGNDAAEIRTMKPSVLKLENSIVARRSAEGALLEAGGRVKSSRVLWYRENAAAPVSLLSGSDLWQDPLFRDWAAGDYRLQMKSPAVDAAAWTEDQPVFDASGENRLNGTAADLGAYECES